MLGNIVSLFYNYTSEHLRNCAGVSEVIHTCIPQKNTIVFEAFNVTELLMQAFT